MQLNWKWSVSQNILKNKNISRVGRAAATEHSGPIRAIIRLVSELPPHFHPSVLLELPSDLTAFLQQPKLSVRVIFFLFIQLHSQILKVGSSSCSIHRNKMDAIQKGWFSEINDLWPGVALSLQVVQILHHERSEYQDVMVLETKSHGRALILDGIIQCTENDEFAYQEMIAYLPLCSHPNPKKVLIVGGGDGGVAREVAKHPDVETIVQVEIDAKVLEVSRKYLPFMSSGLDHPKVTLNVGDGFDFMKKHSGEFDVIITDSSDPVGPAECLFKESYFNLMKTALRPGGIICSQAGTAWANLDHVTETLQHCKSAFPVAAYGIAAVPTYPTGQIGFVLGSLDSKTDFTQPKKVFSEAELDEMKMRYYNEEIHRSAFVLPRFVAKALKAALDEVPKN